MLLFKSVELLQKFLQKKRKEGLRIGFAPTMGALHRGHASLIKKAKLENDICVCSIFVNPTQFNDPKDLEKYPRTEGKDIKILANLENDVLFYPTVDAVYPKNLHIPTFDFGQVDKVMEGKFRPGHFDGVVEVVYRLIDIVKPDSLYMGQKDFQQFTLIQHLLQQMQAKTKLVVCPIIRESDGLALSSRNVRLTPENRQRAPKIAKILHQLNDWIVDGLSIKEAETKAITELSQLPDFRPEYLEIVDGHTLQPIERMEDSDYVVVCAAVWTGDIRLIDNVILKGNKGN
ncbi:MAG: pantoate--beta-alanine ligase [Saprospiraceae bacterium]